MSELDRFLIARYLYANGMDFISDAEYDELRAKLEAEGYKFNPIYEDDEFPLESFKRAGLSQEEIKGILASTTPDSSEHADMLMDSPCLSINSTNSYEEAFLWFRTVMGQDIVLTPKIDGINTRRGFKYEDGRLNYCVALTRGRSANSLDVTENLRYITPRIKDTKGITTNLVVHSETFVPAKHIPYLCQTYNMKLTLPRGAGMSMARTSRYAIEDYWMLHSPVFRVDYGATLTEGLDKAKELGFEVVPYWHFSYNGEDFSTFKQKLDALMREIKDVADSLDYITDGIVAQVNDMMHYAASDISKGYSTSNLALKIGLWQPGVYESTVRSIVIQPQDEQCNCVALVDPVIAQGGQTLQRVNLFNPDIMISAGILPGTRIRFEYKNETTINLIY